MSKGNVAAVILLLILWLSRIPALEALPLHNDEGLHLTRAVEVWNLHPFWEIRDGKIINHWAIALFYPQNAPVFVGRIATVFVGLIGFAAGYALIRHIFNRNAALLAGVLWITCPYLFFFDRLALSDAEAGALVVLALWASWRLAERGTVARAVLTGLVLALATLFKFTAAPFAVSIVLIVLLRARYTIQRRIGLLLTAGITTAACFVVPVGYLLLRGDDLFSIALGWIGRGSGSANEGIGANVAMLAAQLVGFSLPIWSVFLLAGLALLVVCKPRTGGILLLAMGVPLASIVVLGREVLPRHYVVALPALLVAGGAGIGLAIERWIAAAQRRTVMAVSVVALTFGFIPFALHAYTSPPDLRVPQAVWTQYFSEHSSGYGLREAVQALPEIDPTIHAGIVASMTADSCHRANFYAFDVWHMDCPDAPGLTRIAEALRDSPVFVVVDAATGAHFPEDADGLNANARLIATYPRPGADGQPVTVWLLTAR